MRPDDPRLSRQGMVAGGGVRAAARADRFGMVFDCSL
jgi:hypothetical protein